MTEGEFARVERTPISNIAGSNGYCHANVCNKGKIDKMITSDIMEIDGERNLEDLRKIKITMS